MSTNNKIFVSGQVDRKHLPKKRMGTTYETIVGGHKIFMRTGNYPDGNLGEVFLDMHKEGAPFRSLLNCVAMLLSIGLQHGVPISAYCHTLVGMKFEPEGMTTDPEIPEAKSIIDYIFKRLEKDYITNKVVLVDKGVEDERDQKKK